MEDGTNIGDALRVSLPMSIMEENVLIMNGKEEIERKLGKERKARVVSFMISNVQDNSRMHRNF